LFATLAKLTGYKLPNDAGEDSYDIGAVVFGTKRPQRPIREATVHHSMSDEYAIRQGDWVYLDSESGAHGNAEPEWWRQRFGILKQTGSGELFNLKDDPRQSRNLLSQEPERAQKMKALLDKYKTESRSIPRR
jgi:hypothetical protein